MILAAFPVFFRRHTGVMLEVFPEERLVCKIQPVGNLLFRACFIQCEYVIDNVVHHMHRAAVHIQNDIITVIFILMNLMIQRLLNPP